MLNAEKYKNEIQNLLDRGYDATLNKKTKQVVACEEIHCNNCAFCGIKNCFYAMEKWLISEYKNQILDDAEKRYLKGVIRPFRDRVEYIEKCNVSEETEQIFIDIKEYYKKDECLCGYGLPPFEMGKMYKGMEDNKKYTLEELGL